MFGSDTSPMLVVGIYFIICCVIAFIGGPVALVPILGVTLWTVWIQLSTAEAKIKELEARLKE